MDLLVKTVVGELEELNSERSAPECDRRHRISLPASCREHLGGGHRDHREERPHHHHLGLELQCPLGDGATWHATLADEGAKYGELDPAAIDEEMVARHLTTAGMPDPELLIRTSGEQRISNFLLWQIAYAELWFTPVLWPDFRKEHFFQADPGLPEAVNVVSALSVNRSLRPDMRWTSRSFILTAPRAAQCCAQTGTRVMDAALSAGI